MAPRSLRIGIVGASQVARRHVALLRGCPGVRISAVASRSPERAAGLAAGCGARCVADYRELLEIPDLDAIAVLDEPQRHVAPALAAIDRGIGVLLEKPLAARLADAAELVRVAEAARRPVALVSQLRFDGELQAIRRRLASGALGEPRRARIRQAWSRDADYYAAGNGWRGRYGSVLLNQAIHWLDVALWLFGPPCDVEAELSRRPGLETYDAAEVRLGYPNGLRLELSATTRAGEERPEELEIEATRGTLRLRRGGPGSGGALRLQVEEFVAALRGGPTPSVGPREGYEALRLVAACEAAAASGEKREMGS